MATSLDQLRAQHPNLSDDAIADLAAVTLNLSGNNKTRKPFLGLLKSQNPNQPIPELDTELSFAAELAKERGAREALERKLEERDFSASLAAQKNEARARYNLSDDEFKTMEGMMTKGELPADYRFAPVIFRQQTEVSTPTNYGTSGHGPWDMGNRIKESGMEGLMDDPDNFALRTAHAMIDEAQKKRPVNTF